MVIKTLDPDPQWSKMLEPDPTCTGTETNRDSQHWFHREKKTNLILLSLYFFNYQLLPDNIDKEARVNLYVPSNHTLTDRRLLRATYTKTDDGTTVYETNLLQPQIFTYINGTGSYPSFCRYMLEGCEIFFYETYEHTNHTDICGVTYGASTVHIRLLLWVSTPLFGHTAGDPDPAFFDDSESGSRPRF